ncbi:MAG: serine hydrolase domain-containing protein [Phycisphaerales bacterium JB043]
MRSGLAVGATLVVLGATWGVLAQDSLHDDLQSLVDEARADIDVPALGAMRVDAEGQMMAAVSGVRVVGGDDQVTENDLWHIGSITKSFTGTLVARLIERGVVSWDDTVGELLGDHVPEMREEYAQVTFAHLLSHRSGMQANIPIARFGEFGLHPEDIMEERLRWAEMALGQEPAGPMEETFVYSNNGYIVAGAMLEAATGRSWEELMRAEVFVALGLESAGFGGPGEDQPRGHVAGEDGDTAMAPDSDNPAALGPAGTIHMTLADMARYLRAHATRDEGFLSGESYERLCAAPFGGQYALGWLVVGEDARWHNGSNTMWYAEAVFSFEDGSVGAVVMNDGDLQRNPPMSRELLGKVMRLGEEEE